MKLYQICKVGSGVKLYQICKVGSGVKLYQICKVGSGVKLYQICKVGSGVKLYQICICWASCLRVQTACVCLYGAAEGARQRAAQQCPGPRWPSGAG